MWACVVMLKCHIVDVLLDKGDKMWSEAIVYVQIGCKIPMDNNQVAFTSGTDGTPHHYTKLVTGSADSSVHETFTNTSVHFTTPLVTF